MFKTIRFAAADCVNGVPGDIETVPLTDKEVGPTAHAVFGTPGKNIYKTGILTGQGILIAVPAGRRNKMMSKDDPCYNEMSQGESLLSS